MREFKKMAANVHFMLKHCFPMKPAPVGKGYAAIQHHQLKILLKDILFELATSYKTLNPIRGVVPGAHQRNQETTENADGIDMMVAEDLSEWM